MTHGVLYRCQNPNCRLEVEKAPTSIPKGANLNCTCGAPMKKVYTKPMVRELSQEEVDLFFPEFSTNAGKSR